MRRWLRVLQAREGDGLAAVQQMADESPGSLDALVVDAGSGDASLAMSCPPPPFLEPQFLQDARRLLSPGGLLAINCVTRLDSAFTAAAAGVKVRGLHEYRENVLVGNPLRDADVKRERVAVPF